MKKFKDFLNETFAGYHVLGDEEELDPKKAESIVSEIKRKAVKACDAKIAELESNLQKLRDLKNDIQKVGSLSENLADLGWREVSDVPDVKVIDVTPDFKITFKDGLTSFTIRYIGKQKKTVFRAGSV